MTDEKIYKIPSQNLSGLQTKFKQLGRRAKKLGLPEPTFTEIKVERVEEKNEITGLIEKVYLLHHITVDPGIAVVKVAGWGFVATIQHTEEGNIIRKVREEYTIPPQYRSVTQLCEHCNTNRNRKDTYILFNEEENTYKQVGRNCLQDFFGHDALIYAEQAQYLIDLRNISESCEEGFGFGGGGPSYEPLEVYLAYVAECIRVNGWMSRGKVRALELSSINGCRLQATCDVAFLHLHPPSSNSFKPLFSYPSKESQAEANAAIEWAANIEGEDDLPEYLHNIRIIARRMVCETRDMGLAASIVAAHQRHSMKLKFAEIQARRAEIAQHVGNVGDRQRFNLTVERVTQCDSDWGTSHMHVMGDDAGNMFVWFAHGKVFPTGEQIILKGTIKKHNEWNGIKQNLLARCEEVVLKKYYSIVEGELYTFEAASPDEVKKLLRGKLGVKRLPKSTQIIEDIPQVVSDERVAV